VDRPSLDAVTTVDPALVRRLWRAGEPYHAVTYFVPEVVDAGRSVGLAGFWMTYFAARSAPMGAVVAPVVIATFYNFAPAMVARAIPDAWARADPQAVLDAAMGAVEVSLHRLLGDLAEGPDVIVAAAIAREAVEACDNAGRALAAAWADVAWPESPTMQLWLALTALREHRGDGHVAALVGAGLDGCEAHVTLVAAGHSTREMQQRARGWSDDDWDGATQRLVHRGWLDATGVLSAAGRAVRQDVEVATDRLASGAWEAVGPERAARLLALLEPRRQCIDAAELIPYPNPMGLPGPDALS
jgi:hypothetical protein